MFPAWSPSPDDLDLGMREDLADSLAHLVAAAPDLHTGEADDIDTALAEIRAHRVAPAVFGRYFDLVLALSGDDTDTARRLFGEILRMASATPEASIIRYGEEELGDDADRYGRLLDAGSDKPGFLMTPAADEWRDFVALVPEARRLIEAADPALSDELDGLVAQIIAAAPRPGARAFGSVSSVMLWGASTLNVKTHTTPQELAAGLVHETAHHALFALSRREALVANPIDESYPSPLRGDPRPMDGVYHATFVCARLHYLYRLWLDRGLLAGDARAQAERAAAGHQKRFVAGTETIREHGQLTANGDRIMASAQAYFASLG